MLCRHEALASTSCVQRHQKTEQHNAAASTWHLLKALVRRPQLRHVVLMLLFPLLRLRCLAARSLQRRLGLVPRTLQLLCLSACNLPADRSPFPRPMTAEHGSATACGPMKCVVHQTGTVPAVPCRGTLDPAAAAPPRHPAAAPPAAPVSTPAPWLRSAVFAHWDWAHLVLHCQQARAWKELHTTRKGLEPSVPEMHRDTAIATNGSLQMQGCWPCESRLDR